MTHYEEHLLPDGSGWIAEEHVTTDEELLAVAGARRHHGHPQCWTIGPAATEGDQTPGG